jgi:peptidylprolyl isomerase
VRRWLGLVALSGVLLAGAAACASAEEQSGGGPCDVKVGTDLAVKPSITVPDNCDAPKSLESRDIVAGNGAEVKAGDAVSVQYSGVAWSTKEQFDASWDRGAQPFTVQPVGSARVIEGWNQGLIGAKQGSRRLLVIPPDLGYGEQGAGGDIKPGETLVFVVDVVSVNGQ